MKEQILKEKTVETFFIEIGEVERIYKSDKDLSLVLWRALRTDVPSDNPLYPDFERRELRMGKFRNPDVTIASVAGKPHVFPKVYQKRPEDLWKAEGTSLFDRSNTFVGPNWRYFEIPQGTRIPDGLLIIRDDFNERFQATHYSIVPNYAMPMYLFKQLLDRLALNAKQRKEEARHG